MKRNFTLFMATSTSNFVFLKGHNDFLFTIARAAEKNYSDNTPSRNWHLDWQNLLGCRNGGSQRNVVDASQRFTSPESSCDVPKGEKNLDGIILNPLQIPAFPKLFSCDRSTGAFSVDSDACQQAEVDEAVVQNTIDELNLDAERLKRFRKVTLNNLNTQMTSLVREGLSIGEAREKLAKMTLRKNSAGHWPKFFTSIRSYLGHAAEEQLRAIQYTG
jgi:uncharacterized protein (TIGR02646 family)